MRIQQGTPSLDAGSRLTEVRQAVRSALQSEPVFQELDAPQRRQLANAFVRVCQVASELIREEVESEGMVRQAGAMQELASDPPVPVSSAPPKPAPLARAQTAGTEYSGVSAQRLAGTTQAVLNAVSFPRFVTDLINGVFQAMLDSSTQQMNTFVELLNNVAASTEGFADSNVGPDRARQWLADRYPGSFEISGDPVEEGDEEEGGGMTLRLRAGASPPSEEALRVDLGMEPGESIATGDPERNLVPFARRMLARNRQSMLASMVMLGLNRIVIESGRINAAMHFHIDTRSAAQADQGSTFDTRHNLSASGSFGVGPWGASASANSTIGYVSTQRSQTTEEMNTDLDLSSAVEIYFKSDYLPLNRVAGPSQLDRIRQNARNPEAEMAIESERTRQARYRAAAESEAARRQELQNRMGGAPQPQAPAPGAPGSPEAAQRAREEAARREGARTGSPPAAGANPPPSGSPPAAGANPPPSGNPPATGANPPPSGSPPAAGANPPPSGSPPATGANPPPSGSPPAAGANPPPARTPPAAGGNPPPSGSPPATGANPPGQGQ